MIIPKPKLERQLLILHIFHYCRVTEYAEIINLIKGVSRRTIDRDIAELTEAGLLNVVFLRKHNGFIHKDQQNLHSHTNISTENKAKQAHFNKLTRLSKVMFDFGTDGSVIEWYAKCFPDVSKRTIQRDLQILNDIGYRIRYDFYEKQYIYDFPYDMTSIF